MARTVVVVLSLMVCVAAFLLLGAWAARRTHNAADFVIGSRRLGVWSTALGFSAGAVNAWMLFVVAASAFTLGLAASWLALGLFAGAVFALFYIGPRIRIASAGLNAATVTQIISADAGDRLQPNVVRSAVFIIACMLLFQAAVLLRALGDAFIVHFQFDAPTMMSVIVALAAACLIAGGVRTASANDILQSVLIVVLGVCLLIAAAGVFEGDTPWSIAIDAMGPAWGHLFAGKRGIVAGAFAAGAVGVGLAICGQPQALNRLMAARDEPTLMRARWAALVLLAVQLALMLLCGWAAGLLYSGLERPEYALWALADRASPPWLGALLMLALLATLALSVAAPLLTVASSFAIDLRRSSAALSFAGLRVAALFAAILALSLALLTNASVLEHWLFAFTTLGAALGPLLLIRMSGKRVRPGSLLGSMWSAFALAVIFHVLPDSPGDFLQRVLPFVAGLGIALTGGERRRNPDRADRAEETVHDRIPI